MSKNLTRKGLAFGALVALGSSLIAGAPASAVELNEHITIAPTSGPASAYAVYAADGASFSVSASPLSSAMVGSGSLQFHVADSESKFLPGANSSNGYARTVADNAAASVNVTSDMVTVAIPSGVADGTYAFWSATALVLDGEADATVAAAKKLKYGYVINNQLVFTSDADIVDANDGNNSVKGAAALQLVPVSSSKLVTDTDAIATGDVVSLTNSGDVVVVTTSGVADGTYAIYSESATVVEVAADSSLQVNALAANTVSYGVVSNNQLTFTAQNAFAAVDAFDAAEAFHFIAAPGASARASDGSFVVDTTITDSGNSGALEVITTDGVTRTAVVTPFIDDYANGSYTAGTEFAGAATTITFANRSSVAWTTTLGALTYGATSISATATSVPAINGAENDDDSNVRIAFTRQGSSSLVLSADATQASTGIWSASVALAAGSGDLTTLNKTTGADTGSQSWADLTAVATSNSALDEVASSIKDKVATIVADAAHGLRIGDKVQFDGFSDATGLNAGVYTVTAVPSTLIFKVSAAAEADDTALAGTANWDVDTALVNTLFAGDYSAQAAIEDADGSDWFLAGSASARATSVAAAADTVFNTVATANVEGIEVKNDTDSATDADIRTGTLAADVVATIVDVDGASVGAGRPVTYTITRSATTIKVNGATTGDTVYTDANGQVKFAVTDTTGSDGKTVTIAATPEGVSAAATNFTFEWNDAAFTIVDLNTTKSEIGGSAGAQTEKRSILKNASYEVSAFVADQFYVAAASDTFRIRVTGSGVTEGDVALVAGKATIKVTDVAISTNYNSVLTLQKATSGVWADVVAKTLNNLVVTAPSVTLATDGYDGYASTTADLSDAVAAKSTVALDTRTAAGTKPAYASFVTVTGKVASATTGVSQPGSVVTVSGPSSILFENGSLNVAKFGSLTVVSDNTTGEFAVNLYSTSAQKDTVITVTSNGVSSTVKVTFTGVSTDLKKLSITPLAATYVAGQTVVYTILLTDTLGNPVNTVAKADTPAAAYISVSYEGPGIISGSLPLETDADGKATVRIVTGLADVAGAVLTVKYDQNFDGDYVDTNDLTATSTVTSAALANEAASKIGTGNGRVYVNVKNAKGAVVSVKIGSKWATKTSLNNDYTFSFKNVAGAKVAVKVYVDGDLSAAKTITVK